MKLVGFFIFIFISNELRDSIAMRVLRPSSRSSLRLDPFLTPKKLAGYHEASSPSRGVSSRHSFRRSSDESNYSTNSTLESDSGRQSLTRIPQINFYSSIPNALGVIGQGIIWLREISAALGTPIPIWIFTIPFFVLGAGLMFMPDLTQLQLPLFYPDGAGADRDPLAAFPPLPDLEDISNLNIVKQASQFLPSKFIMERFG